MWHYIEQVISQQTQSPFQIKEKHSISGGCINQAWKISDGRQSYFVKTNQAKKIAMFEAEQKGLDALYNSRTIRVPHAIACDQVENTAFLVLEYIPFSHKSNDEQLGRQLAQLHQHTSQQFGFDIDNTIGSTLQKNNWSQNWITFFAEQRLGFQLELAKHNGISHSTYDNGLKLIEKLALFFSNREPQASLLHGDLWSGNYGWDDQGNPVIFDPASYYGDREADIAMTELFGGFSARFYHAYNETMPLDKDYQTRKTLYNLYHILNHCNMFGGGYCAQSDNMIQQLLAKT